MRAIPYLLLLAACGGDTETTDTDTDAADTDTDTDADSDTDTDTDTDADTDTPHSGGTSGEGMLTGEGTATVTGTTSYAGSETISILGDSGYGDAVCTITYDLVSTGVRSDCPTCEWAFDVAIANAAVTLDQGGKCMGALGVDATTVSSWNGTTKAYGFVPEYFGHPDVVVAYDEVYGWRAMAYASWDEASGSLSYLWTGALYPF